MSVQVEEAQLSSGDMIEEQDYASVGVEAFLRRLNYRDQLTEEEREAIRSSAGQARSFAAGELMVEQHTSPDRSLLIAHGMAARSTLLELGDQQITAFHILGDFVDLHSFLLARMDHRVLAVTDVAVVEFTHANLLKVTQRYPHLTRMLWLSTLLDGAIHRQWVVAVARMPGLGHVARLFCEHFARAGVVGLVQEDKFPFDISRATLADALGLSTVHVNRMIEELRRRHLIEWANGEVTVVDWKTLQRLGQFDDTFLDLENRPR